MFWKAFGTVHSNFLNSVVISYTSSCFLIIYAIQQKLPALPLTVPMPSLDN